MNNTHRKTLQPFLPTPWLGVVEWKAIEFLLVAAGTKKIERRGSMVRFVYGKNLATFHRPHPEKMQNPTISGMRVPFWKP